MKSTRNGMASPLFQKNSDELRRRAIFFNRFLSVCMYLSYTLGSCLLVFQLVLLYTPVKIDYKDIIGSQERSFDVASLSLITDDSDHSQPVEERDIDFVKTDVEFKSVLDSFIKANSWENDSVIKLSDEETKETPEDRFNIYHSEEIPKAPSESLNDTNNEGSEILEKAHEISLETNSPSFIEKYSTQIVGGPEFNGVYDGKSLNLYKQITLPAKPLYQKYNIEANFWPVTKYLKRKGWAFASTAPLSKVSMAFTKGKVPYGFGRGKQMLNSIGLSGCIGGSKRLQLECRERLASKHGCKYDDLGIQPLQYSVDNRNSCLRFFERANKPENTEKLWLYKPSNSFHGAGIKLFKGPDKLWQKLEQCKKGANAIVMEYISKPATIKGGYKFDFRSYLLVASLKPQLVFYHDGFVRKADTVYSETDKRAKVHITNSVSQSTKDHFLNFSQLGLELQKELDFTPNFIDKARDYLKRVSLFVFNTARVQPQPLGRINGRWHIFGIDWIVDNSGKIHLLEGNGYPLVTHYHGIGLTPKIWEEMVDLVLAVHTQPETLNKTMSVKMKFHYGGWSLIYNELEELHNEFIGQAYNACKAFS